MWIETAPSEDVISFMQEVTNAPEPSQTFRKNFKAINAIIMPRVVAAFANKPR